MPDSPAILRKAAVLVSCLSQHEADELLESMDVDQAAKIRAMLVDLDEVDPDEQKSVLAEFLHRTQPTDVGQTEGIELDLSLTDRINDEPLTTPHAAHVDDEKVASSSLADVDCETLAKLLRDEHSQTIAVVVAQQTPDHASRIIVRLPIDLQADVLRRLDSLTLPHEELLRQIEQELVAKMPDDSFTSPHDGVTTMEQILQAVEPQERDQLMHRLAERSPAQKQTSRDAHVELTPSKKENDECITLTFPHLIELDDRSLLTLLLASDRDVLWLALAGAPRVLVDRLLQQLPPHEAAQFDRRCESVGPLNLRDVEIAQQHIVEIAGRMIASGQIDWPTSPTLHAA